MQTFNVADRSQSVHRNAILEASAGTGKTYTIENIVSRLIISDDQPLTIDKILVMTFTRAATRELKDRIRTSLVNNLSRLKKSIITTDTPDYLAAYIEKGPESIKKAIRSIEEALLSFDSAQIFTIHSFCWRMLKNHAMEAQIGLEASSREDQSLDMTKLRQAIRDFLRTQLLMPSYSPQQLKLLASKFKNDADKLTTSLLNEASKGINIVPSRSFDELLLLFQNAIELLQSQFSPVQEKIKEDLITLSLRYRGLNTAKNILKNEFVEMFDRFCLLFNKPSLSSDDLEYLIANGLFITDYFFAENINQKPSANSKRALHYPSFIDASRDLLEPIINEARNVAAIFSRVASDCSRFIQKYQEDEELFGHNDLLHQMRSAIDNPSFANCIRGLYSAVIVDEFQDTDPVQWEVFSQLFANESFPWRGYLILVGDPKQSIYSFRQADIYTYLSAIKRLGPDAYATLNTNYRSVPTLVDAINVLFKSSQGIFALPRISQDLPYKDVKAGVPAQCDTDPRLQFWSATYDGNPKGFLKAVEAQYFFPAIADEIIRLHETKGVTLSRNAVLVTDRYQSARLIAYLKSRNIPVKAHRGKTSPHQP
jgi:ATP-dependent exoDNAse (exonuclease V) beta subunit (contains helicase and exonuclease domains)